MYVIYVWHEVKGLTTTARALLLISTAQIIMTFVAVCAITIADGRPSLQLITLDALCWDGVPHSVGSRSLLFSHLLTLWQSHGSPGIKIPSQYPQSSGRRTPAVGLGWCALHSPRRN